MSSLTNKQSCNVQLNKQTNITCPVEQTNNHNIWLQLILVVDRTRARGGENILCSFGLHTAEQGHHEDLYRSLTVVYRSTQQYTVAYRRLPQERQRRVYVAQRVGSRSVCSIGRQLDLASVVWQQSTRQENKTMYKSSRLELNWSPYCSRLFG